ncbi:MAG: diguanylate cyclase [Nitrospirae bacterium]|nr:diguanylate cyclase [Nitrospirota bacterium]
MLRIAIAGGGIGGSALISLLRADMNSQLVGVFEKKAESPGIVLARKWGIPVFLQLEDLVKANPELVINVMGDAESSNQIREAFGQKIEVVEGVGARFLWEIIEKQKRAKIETIKTTADQKILHNLAMKLGSADSLKGFLDLVLAKALDIADAPVGCIALQRSRQMKIMASKGLSRKFLESRSWSALPESAMEGLFHKKEFCEIPDVSKAPDLTNPALIAEKIKSVLVCPMILRGEIAGAIYIYDFKPRQYSERQKNSLALATGIVSLTVDRFALMKGVEEYKMKYAGLIRASLDALLIADSNGLIISCNDATAAMVGYTKDELAGKTIRSLIKSPKLDTLLKKAADRQLSLNGQEITITDAHGRDFEVRLNAAVLKDKTQLTLGTIYVLRSMKEEISLKTAIENQSLELEELSQNLERKVLERTEELEKSNRELERLNQIKGRFIANTSHELRTPLNSILGFSDVLLEKTFGQLNDSQERYVKNIHTAGRHLLELINNVLDIAKIDAGKYEIMYESFRIKDFINEVISIMKPLAEKKFIEISELINSDVDFITADRVKIKQILYNLLSNAIKFTPEGGKVGVRVAYDDRPVDPSALTFPDSDVLKFSVWDTGVGIGPGDTERIFDEFEQADTTLSREFGGAGLGLALSKKLVELHGGTISVESSLGRGSTFIFTVPVTSVAEPTVAEEPEAIGLTFPWVKDEAPLLLVVEDDAATAELLTLHLSQAGYKVAHAYNGEEAIEKARSMAPFAITLDVMLPKKDGWEVLQTLKSDPLTADIPIIIHSIVDNKELAFALGATDYLMKPLDKEALLSKLGEINMALGKVILPSSILIIEEEESVTDYFKEIFEPQGYLIYTAAEGRRGIDLAITLRPSIIFMDFSLSDMLSFDAIQELKENPYTKNVPIFILTERDISVEDRMSLMGKIERIVRKHAFDTKEMIDHIKELEILYPKRAGLIDELTGVFSHRYFQIRLAQEVERATRYKLPLNLVLLDIDYFGNYVEKSGEYHGNIVLKKVSELLRKNIRGSDVVVRYGGDSFAVILPNTIISAGLSLSNRFNAIIKNYPFVHEEGQPKGKITASVGIVFLDGQTTEELILCAEKALASAIRKGGDRVEVYSHEQHEIEQVSP